MSWIMKRFSCLRVIDIGGVCLVEQVFTGSMVIWQDSSW